VPLPTAPIRGRDTGLVAREEQGPLEGVSRMAGFTLATSIRPTRCARQTRRAWTSSAWVKRRAPPGWLFSPAGDGRSASSPSLARTVVRCGTRTRPIRRAARRSHLVNMGHVGLTRSRAHARRARPARSRV